MPTSDLSLRALLAAVSDGASIDWDEAARSNSASVRAAIPDLRMVAQIAGLHRAHDAGSAEDAVPGRLERRGRLSSLTAPLGRWAHLDILEHVASGAFGDVYRAWDPGLDRQVALKLLRRGRDAATAADETVEEGRLLARVRHPNVVSVYGAARVDGVVGIWMEFVAGRTLATFIEDDGVLPPERVVAVGVALSDALDAVHSAGLLHRDVKAQNVILADDGRVVLMDFGTGREATDPTPDIAGTPLYLAPEVRRGAPATPRSDIYSLGVLLRYVATGAFSSSANEARLAPGRWAIRKATRRAAALQRVLQTMTAEAADDRPASAAACGTTLQSISRTTPLLSARAALLGSMMALALAALSAGTPSDGRKSSQPASDLLGRDWKSAAASLLRISPDVSPADRVSTTGEVAVFRTKDPLVTMNLVTMNVATRAQTTWVEQREANAHIETPIVSPDGRQVAYVWVSRACGCSEVRIADASGNVRAVIKRPDVVAAMLGTWTSHLLPVLLVPSAGPRELSLLDTANGTLRTIATPERDPEGFSLSPDAQFLVYDAPTGATSGSYRGLRIVHVPTGRDEVLVDTAADERLPLWTPEGDAVFFVAREGARNRLVVLPVKAGRAVGSAVVALEDVGNIHPAGFSSAGELYYTLMPGPHGIFMATLGAPGDTAPPSVLVSPPRGVGGAASMPHWSADGRFLVWGSQRGFTATDIVVHDVHSREERAFSGLLDDALVPRWSPDGSRIAMWGTDPRTRNIQVLDIATGGVREVYRQARPMFNSGHAWGLDWAADGRELMIQEDTRFILGVDLETGTRRIVHEEPMGTMQQGIAVSPDGLRVGFIDTGGMEDRLMVVPVAGGPPTAIWDSAEGRGAGVAFWAPDGHGIFVSRFVSTQVVQPQRELVRISLGGRAESTGIEGIYLFYASIHPNGRRVAFQTGTYDRELWKLVAPASLR